MSSTPFGGGNLGSKAARMAKLRNQLVTTNKRLDHMMGQHHARALKNARISRLVRKRQLQDGTTVETDQSDLESVVTSPDEDHLRPELEQILIREEEDASRMQTALNADKWSLRRAILLHGNHESLDDSNAALAERNDLNSRLDSKLRKAAADLYLAYQVLGDASQRLQLPDRVTHEATTMLSRYAANRDGFKVNGVSSRLAMKKNNLTTQQRKEAAESLREHNKHKQMGSLCAALLLLTARKLGWPRPLTEVCACVHFKPNSNKNSTSSSFIKPKHCSRAMDEIKSAFPDYARSIVVAVGPAEMASNNRNNAPTMKNDPAATIHFVDHAVRKLQLPPVAEASIRALVWQSCQEQHTTGQQSGTKLSTICASLAYFVCLSGSIMQQLASQAQMREQQQQQQQQQKSSIRVSNNRFRLFIGKSKRRNNKTNKNDMMPPPPKKPKLARIVTADPNNNNSKQEASIPKVVTVESNNGDDPAEKNGFNHDDSDTFDVFSHAVGSELLAQKQEYEMRRVWDAWVDQTSWLRSVSEVEQSSGVASSTIISHYKANIFPRRQALLEWLRDAVVVSGKEGDAPTINGSNILSETPLATVLLSHVAAAAPLLESNGKTR
eukprot:Sro229_g092900.1 n/a (610) ;mRNA; r:13971-15800